MAQSLLFEPNGIDGHPHINGLEKPPHDFGTRAIHVGSAPDKQTGAVIPLICLSTTFNQDAIGVHSVSCLA